MKSNKLYNVSLILTGLFLLINTLVVVIKFSGPICLNVNYNYINFNSYEISERKVINFSNDSYTYSTYGIYKKNSYEKKVHAEGGYYIIDEDAIYISNDSLSGNLKIEIIDKFNIKNFAGEIYEAKSAKNLFIILLIVEGFLAITCGTLITIIVANCISSKKLAKLSVDD